MHNERIIIAGFGGQGVMTMGQMLAQAALDEGRHTSWLPSYGPEMRGGTANCDVIIDDAEIASPIVHGDATSVIILNKPSLKFIDDLVTGGCALINTSLIDDKVTREDIRVFYVPATELAMAVGMLQAANMVLLGAFSEMTHCVESETVLAALQRKLGARKAHLMDANRKAFALGVQCINDQIKGMEMPKEPALPA